MASNLDGLTLGCQFAVAAVIILAIYVGPMAIGAVVAFFVR